MPRRCSICVHTKRTEIEESLLKGDSYCNISQVYSVSSHSARRHKINGHIGKEIIKVGESKIESGNDLFDQVDYWSGEIQSIYQEAKQNKEKSVALTAIDKAMKLVALTTQMKSMFYDIKTIKYFQEGVIAILGEVNPKARDEFVKRLKERYGIL